MKIAIKIDRVYWNENSGVVEFQILDPDMIEHTKLKLRVNQMTVIDVKKEWKETGDKA